MKTAWKHIRRSPYQAFAAILIMFLTFLSISVFSYFVYGSSKVIEFFESKPQVTAFFKDEASKENIDAVTSTLNQSGKVSSVKYVSKEEALKIYQAQNKEDPLLLELVTKEILPASLEVSTYEIADLTYVADVFKNEPFVEQVVFYKDIVATLTSITNAVRQIGIALIILLSTISIILMATIIGFKISQKREEIEIMKLLSATNWYIRWPFLYEGIFYGIFGAVLGWLAATGVLMYVTPMIQTKMGGIPVFPFPYIIMLSLLGIEVGIAIVLGFFSSFLAVLRYLK
jgi:cell division transport system permease protein